MATKIEFRHLAAYELERSFSRGYIVELAEENDGRELWFIQKGLVSMAGALAIHIYADEHPPPHFHVKYGSEENSFSIEDGKPLYAKGLNKYFKSILKWHREHRQDLVDYWNKTRPSDCQVGPIVS